MASNFIFLCLKTGSRLYPLSSVDREPSVKTLRSPLSALITFRIEWRNSTLVFVY